MCKQFEGVVLSGGGAKGAYGAGFLAAIKAADKFKLTIPTRFFSGSSVGGLNAAMAAQDDVDSLVNIYKTYKSSDIIGYSTNNISFRWAANALWSFFTGCNFYVYKNSKLKSFIRSNISFEKIKDSGNHLAIPLTNYKTRDIETYYISYLINKFCEYDSKQPANSQRLRNYKPISDQDHLEQVLLATSAFPTIFPPVEVDGSLYIDRGVGKNTPTSQAAYFGRFLRKITGNEMPVVYCNILSPERITVAGDDLTPLPLTLRVFDLFQNNILEDDIVSWNQINRNSQKMRDKKAAVLNKVRKMNINYSDKMKIRDELKKVSPTTSSTERISMKLLQVRPSSEFNLDHIFDFDPDKVRQMLDDGFLDCLRVLHREGFISEADANDLKNDPGYGLDELE
jgi:NTE family protein